MKPPRRQAAALGYDRTHDAAPRLVARGEGLLADRIIALAREHHVPIHSDPALVAVLARMDIDQQIPPALYRAVAEVLGFLYRQGAMGGIG
jgi:flagellar biosynthesis protein